MKKLSGFAALLGLVTLSLPASAQIISVQFSNGNYGYELNRGTPTARNLSAGVDPATYWNEDTTGGNTVGYPTTVSKTGLVNSLGTVTGISYTGTTDGNFNSSSNGFTSGSGDNLLFSAGSLGAYNSTANVNSFTLNGLSTSDSYSLIVYVNELFNNTTNPIDITAGGTSLYINTDSSASTYVQSTATSAASATAGNYVEFTGLTAATGSLTFTLAATGGSSSAGDFTMPGFQLIDNGAGGASVPEPSTVWLFAFGILGLGLHRYRSRWAKI